MFLGCQKIDQHANHSNTNLKEKDIQEDLTVVGKTSSCGCRTGIDLKCEWNKKKKKKVIDIAIKDILHCKYR